MGHGRGSRDPHIGKGEEAALRTSLATGLETVASVSWLEGGIPMASSPLQLRRRDIITVLWTKCLHPPPPINSYYSTNLGHALLKGQLYFLGAEILCGYRVDWLNNMALYSPCNMLNSNWKHMLWSSLPRFHPCSPVWPCKSCLASLFLSLYICKMWD